ncbi:MAG: phenylacetate--CoA ligase [Succinivibrio dextrinosolvens]|uniref:phenylacetate--CoA ligase family protein n=1 Tax=Succinivibrio sp. TaxID=2053619 RepID=UPI0025EC82E9|nr:phenylacetate--CoA ligase [Succinivibrio sp.]MBQ9221792.1 phenylacetate--CoA ligase [Succinivibrio sp.]MDY6417070.1 phenylacetate--CoA ligase [Succinivibrio dextrinosolvens]MDY6419667.1 phenylacetate--CoA ligase [Succinivibrio dextrinosolvens]MDY6470360.1 phenylacetate--CoA ligase [Succinivibrio dextrinosolvens]
MLLNERQLELVDRQIKRLIKTDSFYGQKYRELGLTGCSCQEDFDRIPFSSKEDLRFAYPLGIQAVEDREVVRIHSSSGTTGKPVIIPYTAKDVEDWATMFCRCYEIAGINNHDRIQITPGYGLWTAGIGFQAGCEKLGAMAIPMGPGNTEKQLQMMIDLKSTVICATSSYALLLSEEISRRGLKDQIFLKKGVIGSERWSDKMRNTIRNSLGIELYDIYGLTEIYGPGIGISCEQNSGMHYFDDYVYIEIIDPVTGERVEDGKSGEIVITTLVKEGAPLLRFRTHDLSRIIPGKCACGRDYPRLDVITGRSDDMFKIHGVNMFPSQIESILGMVDGVGSEYRIILGKDVETRRDVLHVTAEAEGRVDFAETARRISKLVKSKFGVTPKVAIVPAGTLARSEKKTKRVEDQREKV